MRPVVGYDNYRQDLVRREQQRLGVGPYAPPQAPAPAPDPAPAPTQQGGAADTADTKPQQPQGPRWGTYEPTGARPTYGGPGPRPQAPTGPGARPQSPGGRSTTPATETPPVMPQGGSEQKLGGRWDGKYPPAQASKSGSSIKNAEKQVAMRRASNAKRR